MWRERSALNILFAQRKVAAAVAAAAAAAAFAAVAVNKRRLTVSTSQLTKSQLKICRDSKRACGLSF